MVVIIKHKPVIWFRFMSLYEFSWGAWLAVVRSISWFTRFATAGDISSAWNGDSCRIDIFTEEGFATEGCFRYYFIMSWPWSFIIMRNSWWISCIKGLLFYRWVFFIMSTNKITLSHVRIFRYRISSFIKTIWW